MAGIGLVAGADVYSQPHEGKAAMSSTPAGWATIWFGIAMAYLILIYTGMFNISH